MRALHHASESWSQDDQSVARRLLRCLGATVLANPMAFAVAGTCLYLLTHLVVGINRAWAEGTAWGLCDVASCGAYALTLLALTGLALGYITLMAIVGWKGKA